MDEILKNPTHYKPLKYDLKGERRVHILKSFVLKFEVDKIKRVVTFLAFKHHDDAYQRQCYDYNRYNYNRHNKYTIIVIIIIDITKIINSYDLAHVPHFLNLTALLFNSLQFNYTFTKSCHFALLRSGASHFVRNKRWRKTLSQGKLQNINT